MLWGSHSWVNQINAKWIIIAYIDLKMWLAISNSGTIHPSRAYTLCLMMWHNRWQWISTWLMKHWQLPVITMRLKFMTWQLKSCWTHWKEARVLKQTATRVVFTVSNIMEVIRTNWWVVVGMTPFKCGIIGVLTRRILYMGRIYAAKRSILTLITTICFAVHGVKTTHYR